MHHDCFICCCCNLRRLTSSLYRFKKNFATLKKYLLFLFFLVFLFAYYFIFIYFFLFCDITAHPLDSSVQCTYLLFSQSLVVILYQSNTFSVLPYDPFSYLSISSKGYSVIHDLISNFLSEWFRLSYYNMFNRHANVQQIDLKVPLFETGALFEDLKSILIILSVTEHYSFLFITPAHLQN